MKHRTIAMDVTKYSRGDSSIIEETVPIEAPVELILNGQMVARLSCTPVEMKYLGVGHLISRKLLTGRHRLLDINICTGSQPMQIRIRTRENPDLDEAPREQTISEDQRISVSDLLSSVHVLEQRSRFFRETGSAHRSMVFCGDRVLADHEDIARHNTLDKVLGNFYCNHMQPEGAVLCTTGRLFYEIVFKGAAGRFPVIASKGAATDRAVNLALEKGITLVGFARGDRFNIYSHPERIAF
ncbi:MAG: formate dehydrogenase accessory sulfurtransferase FdhD [Bacillota bacterium]|jgi:FdhD protein